MELANNDPTKPPGLRSLKLQRVYRTHYGTNPISGFFRPCLEVSTSYDRAVGYFTSASLRDLQDGLNSLVARGGKIRLITSPHLNKDDIHEIETGYRLRETILNDALVRELQDLQSSSGHELGYLGRLIRDGHLDLRVAYMRGEALYHEKIGFFVDEFGNRVYFNGSNNATDGGQRKNLESFTVMYSWNIDQDQKSVIEEERNYFEILWASRLDNVSVAPLSEVPRSILERCARELPPDWEPPRTEDTTHDAPMTTPPSPPVEPPLRLRPYQTNAIAAWLDTPNPGRGILKMATGTGKTITAVGAIEELRKRKLSSDEPLLVVITAPLKTLVEQWADALARWSPLCCFETAKDWYDQATKRIQELKLNIRTTLVMITTETTFSLEHLPKVLRNRGPEIKMLFIADEVHGYGSRTMRTRLPQDAEFRLGLSATPESKRQEETDALLSYFGAIDFTYSLSDAIRDGFLSRYTYTALFAELSTEELREYGKYSGLIAALLAKHGGYLDPSNPDFEKIMSHSRKRDAVISQSDSKTAEFESQFRLRKDQYFQLVYCAEGTSPLKDVPQFDQVKDFLGNQLGVTLHDFVSDTPRALRRRILDDFGEGTSYQVLVAKRCLDEGVDIPDARTAYLLASTDDPRQWTQRRGRILRLPRRGEKTAEIIDIVVLPTRSSVAGRIDSDKDSSINLIKDELRRVAAFAADAANRDSIDRQLDDILQKYGMTRNELKHEGE
jgi:superfamily II DNA or RNA helicase